MVFMLIETRMAQFRQYIIVPIVSMPISQSFENVSPFGSQKKQKDFTLCPLKNANPFIRSRGCPWKYMPIRFAPSQFHHQDRLRGELKVGIPKCRLHVSPLALAPVRIEIDVTCRLSEMFSKHNTNGGFSRRQAGREE